MSRLLLTVLMSGALALALAACAPRPEPVTGAPPVVTEGGIAPADRQAWLDGSSLVYASDYLSFVGRDGQGFTALALDTNRGRDREAYQAQHYAALHDQEQGWVEIAGTGRYENRDRELVGLPDSPFFRFEGAIGTGLTVASAVNGLQLAVGPVTRYLARHDATTFFALGSAPATLRWEGRTIKGRVIHEDLLRTGFNMITRPDVSGLHHFNGFYLLTADGGDLYLHGTEGRGAGVPEPVLGFQARDGQSVTLRDLRIEETDHGSALGFYRWPTAWRATWEGAAGPAALTLASRTRQGMVNWLLGGYALAIVEGELSEGGRTTPVYGWGELIR